MKLHYVAAVLLACNQVTYDQIYKGIIEQVLHDNNIKARNGAINKLRELCNGQKSTYEYRNNQYQLRRANEN